MSLLLLFSGASFAHTKPAPELLIPTQLVVLGGSTDEGQLVEGLTIPWAAIVREIERDPTFLYQVHWRKVEELIAAAYAASGWIDVTLTPRSGDKGRDIIATLPGRWTFRIVDQVKAYAPGNPVPADDVRSLAGVLHRDQNVSKAILTTTSTFAPGIAEEWKKFIPHRLQLVSGEELTKWLRSLKR